MIFVVHIQENFVPPHWYWEVNEQYDAGSREKFVTNGNVPSGPEAVNAAAEAMKEHMAGKGPVSK